MATTANYQVAFPEWYDERGEWEAKEKGWLQGVEVRFANGHAESLFFYDPVRLAQDLDAESKLGKPCVAVPGMVVIPAITRRAILDTIAQLVESGYFSLMGRAA